MAAPNSSRVATDGGFTLTEMMIVLVIVGVLSAVATPYMARDRKAAYGREFAAEVAREMQHAHVQAMAERLPIRTFIYRDRIELRSWVPGANPGDAPRAPTTTDPVLRTITARLGVDVYDVLAGATPVPVAPVLTAAAGAKLDFNSQGQMQFVGQPPMTSAFMFVRNSAVQSNHPDAYCRIDVRSLTGYVAQRTGW
jgi:prepilin-type N-terminal cleavage/methylation domain-containing protein